MAPTTAHCQVIHVQLDTVVQQQNVKCVSIYMFAFTYIHTCIWAVVLRRAGVID